MVTQVGEVSDPLEGLVDCPTCRRRLVSEGSTVESGENRARKPSSAGSTTPSVGVHPWDHIWPYVALPRESGGKERTDSDGGGGGGSGGVAPTEGSLAERVGQSVLEGWGILKDHVSIKSRIHDFDARNQLPLAARDDVHWTHFGGK